jgi:hypothetical protein
VVVPIEDIKQRLSLCQLSYKDPTELTRSRVTVYIDSFKFIDHRESGTQLYVFLSVGVCEVCFRGSSQPLDFMHDARFTLTELIDNNNSNANNTIGMNSEVKVHKGFLSQFNAIKSDLNDFLTAHSSAYTSVVFSGHSLGAALSTIALVYYCINNNTSDGNGINGVKCVKSFTFVSSSGQQTLLSVVP